MKDEDYEQLATKIMINALERVKAQIRKAYDKGYKDGLADTPFTDTEEAEKKAYNRGLNDAWDIAKKIMRMDIVEKDAVFAEFGRATSSVILDSSVTEVIQKIKAYEDKQKQDAEIKVGDEIVCEDAHVVITYISPINEWNGFLLNSCESGERGQGYTLMYSFKGWQKTGRHFDQIAEVLAELRGAENDG